MPTRHHISQLFNLPEGADLDFFDANLEFDTPVFIDPFLLKKSPNPTEAALFERFTDYFKFVYDQAADLSLRRLTEAQFKRLVTFHEPKNINMGYTEASNDGKGPNLAERLLKFFVDNSAKKFIRETKYFPDEQYNPVSLQLFTDGIGPDGISDITANLMMDYLIGYTIEQADKWDIPRKPNLPLDQDGFDFDDMTWKGGGYYELPENPLRPNEPLIFVPKRLLRGFEEVQEGVVSGVFKVLRADPELSTKFASLLSRAVKNVSIDEIRHLFLENGSVHFRYLQRLEERRAVPYDFSDDFLGLLSDKNYATYFQGEDLGSVDSCEDLKAKTEKLIAVFNTEFSKRDGWRDAWKRVSAEKMKPQTEPTIGRRFRGMGYAFFDHFEEVTFVPEAGTGNGLVDFHIIHKGCRIVVELKLLYNASPKGKSDPIPAYMHGIMRQLPEYVELAKAKHGYYITGQHYDGNQGTKTDHSYRIQEIQDALPEVEAMLKRTVSGFVSLNYINVEMMPRESASKL